MFNISQELPCWLLRSVCEACFTLICRVLTSFFLSITGLHVPHQYLSLFLCSYAFKRGSRHAVLPCPPFLYTFVLQDQVLKSGSLNKKAQRTKRWIKHWFVLKNDALSWYQSSSVSSITSLVYHNLTNCLGSVLSARYSRSSLRHSLRAYR